MRCSTTPRTGPAVGGILAGIPGHPRVIGPDLTPPPGRGAPSGEGVAPWVSPTPTRPRVTVPLLKGVMIMTDGLPRRHTWRIDNINNAPDAETALRRMFEFARAEAAKCAENRPADADGFRWQMIHALLPIVAPMYKSHPKPVPHELTGGGWTPHRARQRAAEARHP